MAGSDLATNAGTSASLVIMEKLIAEIPNATNIFEINDSIRHILDESGEQIKENSTLGKLHVKLFENILLLLIKKQEIAKSKHNIFHDPIKAIKEFADSHPYVVAILACTGMTYITIKLELLNMLRDFLRRRRPPPPPTNN